MTSDVGVTSAMFAPLYDLAFRPPSSYSFFFYTENFDRSRDESFQRRSERDELLHTTDSPLRATHTIAPDSDSAKLGNATGRRHTRGSPS